MMKGKNVKRLLITILLLCIFCVNDNIASAATSTKTLTLKNKTLTVYKGETKALGVKKNTTGSKVTFISSNKKIATVSSKGTIKGIKNGVVTVTASAGKKKATCLVTVKTKVVQPKSVEFKINRNFYLDQGFEFENPATVYPANATNKSVKYSSTDTSVVKIEQNGKVTTVGQGVAYIVATASNGVSKKLQVEVTGDVFEGEDEVEPIEKDTTLSVKQGSINLGDNVINLIASLGTPAKILKNEYGCESYVYNQDYSSLVIVYVKYAKVVGYYTNASYFKCADLYSGMLSEELLRKTQQAADLDVEDKYRINYLIDTVDNKKLLCIEVLDWELRNMLEEQLPNLGRASESLIKDLESVSIDIINGYRKRFGVMPIQTYDTVSIVARNHSLDMYINDYADHTNLQGLKPRDRLAKAGIATSGIVGEVLGKIPFDSIWRQISDFMNSEHREAILHPVFNYAGAGIALGDGSSEDASTGYVTIIFYQ